MTTYLQRRLSLALDSGKQQRGGIDGPAEITSQLGPRLLVEVTAGYGVVRDSHVILEKLCEMFSANGNCCRS